MAAILYHVCRRTISSDVNIKGVKRSQQKWSLRDPRVLLHQNTRDEAHSAAEHTLSDAGCAEDGRLWPVKRIIAYKATGHM
jgi:hypothetical protein